MIDQNEELMRFVRGECDPAAFPHREHLRMAFEMLRRHSFAETVLHYSRALRSMAARSGRPEAYHETITVAFLSLIGERMSKAPASDFAQFESENSDLGEKGLLACWYRPERLASDAARRTFVLPEPQYQTTLPSAPR